MEGKAPWVQKGKSKKDITASVTESKASENTPATPTTQTAASAITSESTHRQNLSFAVIEEVDQDYSHLALRSTSTILDSGTTSTLIMDCNVFWTYSLNSSVKVKTANHDYLSTSGRGDCIADLVINGHSYRIRLTDCLHASGAYINLLSISRMLKKGWACNFQSFPPWCELSHRGEPYGVIPEVSDLFSVDLRFIRPGESVLYTSPSEIAAFAHVTLTWDLWHACLGHIGGEAVKRAPLIATGVQVDKDAPLQRCEPCIIAKHPRKPFPPSEEPRAVHPLDIVHSDLCGPFPIVTPHGKHHFIIFLDDHSHLLNLQLLATKDQALEAWCVIKNHWENHLERKVKVFRSDNRGEFINVAFSKTLQDARIEWQLSAPYAHQQNGKAERAMHMIEGRLFALLETARLPATLWGKAVLTVCYLWNRSESQALPSGTTPYEVVNGKQPDLSHLHVFGSYCFTCIPTEIQSKLGPHSCEAIFMGYPDGTKGYRLCDKLTGTFFVARNVIFDENLPSVMYHSDSDDESDDAPVSAPSATPPPLSADPHHTPAPPAPQIVPHKLSRTRILTQAGKDYAKGIAASKAHLSDLHEAHAPRIPPSAPLEGVLESTELTSDATIDALAEIEPNVDVPEALANLMIPLEVIVGVTLLALIII